MKWYVFYHCYEEYGEDHDAGLDEYDDEGEARRNYTDFLVRYRNSYYRKVCLIQGTDLASVET